MPNKPQQTLSNPRGIRSSFKSFLTLIAESQTAQILICPPNLMRRFYTQGIMHISFRFHTIAQEMREALEELFLCAHFTSQPFLFLQCMTLVRYFSFSYSICLRGVQRTGSSSTAAIWRLRRLSSSAWERQQFLTSSCFSTLEVCMNCLLVGASAAVQSVCGLSFAVMWLVYYCILLWCDSFVGCCLLWSLVNLWINSAVMFQFAKRKKCSVISSHEFFSSHSH